MFRKHKDPQVLIVGAGPVGLFTALKLARRGIACRVVDEEWRTASHSYALALHAESLRLLEEAGVLGELLEQSYRVRSVGLYDDKERRAGMSLGDLHEDFSFVAVTRQDVLESCLERALIDAGVHVDWNHRILRPRPEGERVEVPVQKLTKSSGGYAVTRTEWLVARDMKWNVPFVVGCDGHRSLVRRSLGIPFDETGPPLHAAVFEFRTDFDPGHELRVVLGDEVTSVMWPMPDGYVRWSFQLPSDEVDADSRIKGRVAVQIGGQHFPLLQVDQLRRFLKERAPWFDGSIEDMRWRMAVRFDNRLAGSFGQGRQWLAGDAAHMTGPIGGQSMNVGLREGADLARRIGDLVKSEADPAALAEYERERHEEWSLLAGIEGGLAAGPKAAPWVAERAARLLPCIPAAGADLRNLVRQVGLDVSFTSRREDAVG